MTPLVAAARALASGGAAARLVPRRVRGALLRRVAGVLLDQRRLDELLDALAGEASSTARAGGAARRPVEPGPAAVAPRPTMAGLRRLPATCLHRALAGYAALRPSHDDVRFVLGVRQEGGEVVAHAWIEQAGTPVGEPTDPRAAFTVAWVHPVPERSPRHPERPMSALSPSPDVVLTRLADGTGVVLDLATKFYFTLNRTGVVVWETIARAGRVVPDEIVEALLARFASVDRATAEADVRALLAALEAEGLLRKRG